MSCWTHGPPSFPGLCQQIFRNLLAEERTLFAAPSTPVEFLDADCLQGLSTAFVPHLVFIFISFSLLGSDSCPSNLQVSWRRASPDVVPHSAHAICHEEWTVSVPSLGERDSDLFNHPSQKWRCFLSASFILTADILLGMGSCPSELFSSPIPSSPQSGHISVIPILTHCLTTGPVTFPTHFILKETGKTLEGIDWEVTRSHFFVIKITLNLVDELERWGARRGRETHHKAGPGSRGEMRGSGLSPWQKRWRREQGTT